MEFLFLTLAILLEVCGTTCMKLSDGFRKPLPSVFIFIFYIACFGFMTLAMKKLPVSFVYAVWSGLGTAIVTVVGALYFNESVNPGKLASIGLIILGLVALQLSGGSQS